MAHISERRESVLNTTLTDYDTSLLQSHPEFIGAILKRTKTSSMLTHEETPPHEAFPGTLVTTQPERTGIRVEVKGPAGYLDGKLIIDSPNLYGASAIYPELKEYSGLHEAALALEALALKQQAAALAGHVAE